VEEIFWHCKQKVVLQRIFGLPDEARQARLERRSSNFSLAFLG
jgi:hypothetical protein